MNEALDEYLADIRAAISANPPPDPDQERAVREQERLMEETYPGEWVAFRDVWDGGVFVRREVLAHDRSFGAVNGPLLAKYPEAEIRDMCVAYCEPAELRRLVRASGFRLVPPPDGSK